MAALAARDCRLGAGFARCRLPYPHSRQPISPAIGIDFGTSTTAAAILRDGMVRIVPLEARQETLPAASSAIMPRAGCHARRAGRGRSARRSRDADPCRYLCRRVRRVILVGGSSLLSVVEGEVRAALPKARAARSNAFTAVLRGLAQATDAGG